MAEWTYLQCLPVEGNGLVDQTLLSLDVGQIIERVSVIGVHPQGSVVAFFSLTNLRVWERERGRFLQSTTIDGLPSRAS